MAKRFGYIQFTLVLLFIVGGWYVVDKAAFRKETASSLEIALQSARDNRVELEKVLRHYQKDLADSLKYKAACFLIENMPFYTYSTGKQLDNYKSYYIGSCAKVRG